MRTVTIDHELLEQAHTLRERAASLRTQAETLVPVLGATYRRRASELELEAFVSELQSGVPYDEVTAPAA
jgi:CHAD domain-containing protein